MADKAESLLPTMLASASAGMIARIPCHPIDTCKAKIQVQRSGGEAYRNVFIALSNTFKHEGVRGLYKGFGTAFIGSAPAGCLYFTSYEASKKFLTSVSGDRASLLVDFTSGLIAEVFSCVLWVPIDVIKERLQVQSTLIRQLPDTTLYKGNIDAAVTIMRTEGLRGIYKGYGATLMSFGPFSAFYFLFYERLKKISAQFSTPSHPSSAPTDLPFHLILFCAATSGALASFVTNPLDLAKLRIQIDRRRGGSLFNYRNVFDGVRRIWGEEGMRGLFRGVGARMAFSAPTTAISLTCFEELKKAFTSVL